MAKTNVYLNNGVKPQNKSGFRIDAPDLVRDTPSVKRQEGKDLRTGRSKSGK